MQVKIIPADADAPALEITPTNGQKIAVPSGATVKFEGATPVVAVPVGLDLVVFFEDGSSIVLVGFFDFEEGSPPSIDLGEGKSLYADYGFQGEEGPIGVLLGDAARPSALGYEPFPFSEMGSGGIGSSGPVSSGVGGGLNPITDAIDGLVTELLASEPGNGASFSDGERVELPPSVCPPFLVRSGFGNLKLSFCNDVFTVTRRDGNNIDTAAGNDTLVLQTFGADLDVQDNIFTGGFGTDTILLSAAGAIGTTRNNDSDVERNTVYGDLAPGEVISPNKIEEIGDDTITLEAKSAQGDVGRNTVDAGGGKNTVRLNAFTDVEFNNVTTGGDDDTVTLGAGANFSGGADLPRFNVIAFDLPGGGDDLPAYDSRGSGMVFNVLGDEGLDNVSWVDRSPGSDDAILAVDRNGDGQITSRDEIDFSLPAVDSSGVIQVDSTSVDAGGFLIARGEFADFGLQNREFTLALDFDRDGLFEVTYDVTTDANGVLEFNTGTGLPTEGTNATVVLGQIVNFRIISNVNRTSLEGIRAEFDTNDDGVFDANDDAFGDFLLWQDGNADGRGFGDELRSLSDHGIQSINLTSDGVFQSFLGDQAISQGNARYQVTDDFRDFRISSGFVIESEFGTGGDVVLTGNVGLADAVVRVSVDLNGDGAPDVGYEVTSTGTGDWTLDTSVDFPVGGVFVPPAAGASFAYQSHAVIVGADGQVKVAGQSTEVSTLVVVALDVDANGSVEAAYEVMTDVDGKWILDTAVDSPIAGSFDSLLHYNLSDVSLVAVEGGENSQRGDNQNNNVDTGGGIDDIDLTAHQDVRSVTVFAGAGDDNLLVRSDIDDILTNEFFLGRGADTAVVDAQENIFDNAIVLGLNPTAVVGGPDNRDSLLVEGDRINQNVIVGGDDSSDVVYEVITNADGSWTLNTGTAIPVGALLAIDPLTDGTLFDVNADVTGATVVTTEESLLGGAAVIQGVAAGGRGNAIVKVGLDLDRDGSLDVEYEVRSDQNGFWTLDTGVATPGRGTFANDLTPGQMFDVSQITLVRNDILGRPEVKTEVAAGAGDVEVMGVAEFGNGEAKVGLDLDRDGVVDVAYDVDTDPAGIWTLNTAVATPTSGVFTPVVDGQFFDVVDIGFERIVAQPESLRSTLEGVGSGDVLVSGVVGTPNAPVTVELDLDRDGTVDVTYDLMSDAGGAWTLNTAMETSATGMFEPLLAGQLFDVSTTGNPGVVTVLGGGGLEVQGSSTVLNGKIKLALNLDQDPAGVAEVEYDVATDAAGNWILNTLSDTPVKGVATRIEVDQEIDLTQTAFAIDGSGDVRIEGTVDHANTVVNVSLDLNQDGTDIVTYQVRSDSDGRWTVDTNGDAVSSGAFVPLMPAQIFDVSADKAVTAVESVAGEVMASGTVNLANAKVRVELDQGQDGIVNVAYEVMSDANGNWVLDASMEPVVSGAPIVPLAGEFFNVAATSSLVDGAGHVTLAGVSNILSGTVAVGLNLDQMGADEVVYNVRSDSDGNWRLDTNGDEPTAGTFTALAPNQAFDITASVDPIPDGGLRLAGKVDLANAFVTVALNLDQEGPNDVQYRVVSDADGSWAVDTNLDVPISGVFESQNVDPKFDVTVLAAVASEGNFQLQGEVDLPNSFVTVRIVLDLVTNQSDPGAVEFEVQADQFGIWRLDTATDPASGGVFTPLEAGQTFSVTATPTATDTVIDSQIGVPGGGTDIDDNSTVSLDIDETFATTGVGGLPVITGTSILGDKAIEVGLNLVNGGVGGDNGDDITLDAIGEIVDNEISAGAGDDVVRLKVTGEPTVRPEDVDIVVFEGGINKNVVRGRSGDDTISLVVDGAGNGALGNIIDGGLGVDTVSVTVAGAGGVADANEVSGQSGDDSLSIEATGSGGQVILSTLDGGAGNDELIQRATDLIEQTVVRGGDGEDTIQLRGTDSGAAGIISDNNVDGGAGNDLISLVSVGNNAGGTIYASNTITGGAGDDVVELGGGPFGANFNLQVRADGGSTEEVEGDRLRLLDGGTVDGSLAAFPGVYNVTNFEIFDVTNGDVNDVTMPFAFFDLITGSGPELTLLGDAAGDTVNLGGDWFFDSDDTIDPTRFAFTNDSNLLDGDQGTRTLFVDTGLLDELDLSNGLEDNVLFDVASFDLFVNGVVDGTTGGTTLTILGDAGMDVADLSSGEWTMVGTAGGLDEYEDNLGGAVTRTLFIQDTLATSPPMMPAPGFDPGFGADDESEMEIDFGALAGVAGDVDAADADGVAGLVAEQLLDVSGSEYGGVLAAVDALGSGDGAVITPMDLSVAQAGGADDGFETLVGSPGPLVEGEAAVDDGLGMA